MYACAACSNVGALASATRSAKNGEGRSWMFRTRRDGKLRDMGLGGWRSVTLKRRGARLRHYEKPFSTVETRSPRNGRLDRLAPTPAVTTTLTTKISAMWGDDKIHAGTSRATDQQEC